MHSIHLNRSSMLYIYIQFCYMCEMHKRFRNVESFRIFFVSFRFVSIQLLVVMFLFLAFSFLLAFALHSIQSYYKHKDSSVGLDFVSIQFLYLFLFVRMVFFFFKFSYFVFDSIECSLCLVVVVVFAAAVIALSVFYCQR